jgi:uncharacterized protein with FMN-binding domain
LANWRKDRLPNRTVADLLWVKVKKHSAPKTSGNKKASNSLVAVSSAAVLAVYAAGYTRTQAAATKLDVQSVGRRAPAPPAARTEQPVEVAEPKAAADTGPTPVVVASVKPVAAAAPVEVAKVVGKVETKAEVAAPAPEAAPVTVAEAKAPEVKAAEVKTAEAKPAPDPKTNPAVPPWKDGTYQGWGSCRHGDLEATVVIEGGRITSSTISQCLTRYSCDIIDALLPEPPKKQSPNVSSVSGATQSADAFYYALYDALAKAK